MKQIVLRAYEKAMGEYWLWVVGSSQLAKDNARYWLGVCDRIEKRWGKS